MLENPALDYYSYRDLYLQRFGHMSEWEIEYSYLMYQAINQDNRFWLDKLTVELTYNLFFQSMGRLN